MPRLSPMPRPAEPPGGYDPCPIDPDWDRKYILNEAGEPVRVYDFGVLARWESWEGKGFQMRDQLPEYNAEVWTYFSCWGSMHDDKPPEFRTILYIGGAKTYFSSETWEQAQDKHQRVVEKVRRTLPKKDAPPAKATN